MSKYTELNTHKTTLLKLVPMILYTEVKNKFKEAEVKEPEGDDMEVYYDAI